MTTCPHCGALISPSKRNPRRSPKTCRKLSCVKAARREGMTRFMRVVPKTRVLNPGSKPYNGTP